MVSTLRIIWKQTQYTINRTQQPAQQKQGEFQCILYISREFLVRFVRDTETDHALESREQESKYPAFGSVAASCGAAWFSAVAERAFSSSW